MNLPLHIVLLAVATRSRHGQEDFSHRIVRIVVSHLCFLEISRKLTIISLRRFRFNWWPQKFYLVDRATEQAVAFLCVIGWATSYRSLTWWAIISILYDWVKVILDSLSTDFNTIKMTYLLLINSVFCHPKLFFSTFTDAIVWATLLAYSLSAKEEPILNFIAWWACWCSCRLNVNNSSLAPLLCLSLNSSSVSGDITHK